MTRPEDSTLPAGPFVDTDAPTLPVGEPWPPAPTSNERRRPAPNADGATRIATEAADRVMFFFSGFDPKGASFYHRLLRDGIGLRNASHADTMTIGPRLRIGRWASTWTLQWRSSPADRHHQVIRTRCHFMRWDDLVRSHWKRTPLQLLRDYGNIYVRGIASGVFTRVRQRA
ncbi:MAG TPA: hypothetical protein VH328_15315, partial [Burkholderiaceae bacterium]|nr:hypothetical protein [Burkholderiaceae bacterium]